MDWLQDLKDEAVMRSLEGPSPGLALLLTRVDATANKQGLKEW